MTFKFGENETVADLEGVDENLRPFYVKNEEAGHFVIRDELQGVAKAWDGINNANSNIRKENKNLSTSKIDLAGLSEYGTTPAEILETFTKRTKEMHDALEKKEGHVNPEKIRVEMKKAHTAELEDVNRRADSYKDQLYNTLVTNEAMKAINEYKGNAELLLGFVTKNVVMKDVDGKLEPWVIDEDGDRRMGGAGSYMTVAELVKNMKGEKKFAALFEANVNNGSHPPNNRTSQGGPLPPGQKRNSADRIQAALDKRAGR